MSISPDADHENPETPGDFLHRLDALVRQRLDEAPEGSYTAALAAKGESRVAQKVGEEAVEFVLAAVSGTPDEQIGEAADLLYHVLVLLNVKGLRLSDAVNELERRHRRRPKP